MNAFRQLCLAFLLVAAAASAAQPEYLWTTVFEDSGRQSIIDAELTSSGEIVVLRFGDEFRCNLSNYSLEGKKSWSLDIPLPRMVYNILPINSPRGEILLFTEDMDTIGTDYFIRVSSKGELLEELPQSSIPGLYYTNKLTADSTVKNGFIGIYTLDGKSRHDVLRCFDWDFKTLWSYDCPSVNPKRIWYDVLLIGEYDLIIADQQHFSETGQLVSYSNGVRSRLTVSRETMGNHLVWTSVCDVLPRTLIEKIIGLKEGYMIIGDYFPEEDPYGYVGTFLAKLNRMGDTLWTGTYPQNGVFDELSGPLDVVETSDGRYYIIFKSDPMYSEKPGFIITEISATGRELSSERYGWGEFHPQKLLRYSAHEMIMVGDRDAFAKSFFMCFRY